MFINFINHILYFNKGQLDVSLLASFKKKNQPELRSTLFVRPRIEEDQPMLLKTSIDIAMYGSASHEKRQNTVYRSIKTLNELTEKL